MLIAADQTLILGAPGCGKTTTLLNYLDKHLSEGIKPNRIAYVSFTKKAVNEALTRTITRFGGAKADYPYFRTLHSLCLNNIPMDGLKIFDAEQKAQFGKLVGVKFSDIGGEEVNGMTMGNTPEDWCLFIENLSRNRLVSLRDQYNTERFPPASYHMVEYFASSYKQFKSDYFLIDFTEMLALYIERGIPIDVDVAIIDEAQDLSPLQWRVVQRAFKNVKKIYIAGDDDQAIHEWAGADVETFLNLGGERITLEQSYRIPHKVWEISQKLINSVKHRFAKVFNSREESGVIHRYGTLDMLNFERLEGTILCLARHKYQLPKIEAALITAGIVFHRSGGTSSVTRKHVELIYAWERLRNGKTVSGAEVIQIYDAIPAKGGIKHGQKARLNREINQLEQFSIEDLRKDWGLLIDGPWFEVLTGISEEKKQYYLSILRKRGHKALLEEPRATVSTIHGAKGGEADHVVLLTDVTRRTFEEAHQHAAAETRVFYVAVTRAKKELHIISPNTIYGITV